MQTVDLEDLARRSGFVNLEEMRELLLRVRLRWPHERSAYERWASWDGTKTGLLRLVNHQAAAGSNPNTDTGDGSAP
jgi:hypothetical protein